MRKLIIKRERALACFALPYHCVTGRSVREHLDEIAKRDREELMTARIPGTIRSGETICLPLDDAPSTLFVIAYREIGELISEVVPIPAGSKDLSFVIETEFDGFSHLSLHLHETEALPATEAERTPPAEAPSAEQAEVRRRLAVFFPGIGYTAEKPLLYHSRRLAAALGYEPLVVSYGDIPPGVWRDREKTAAYSREAMDRAAAALAEKDLSAYNDILFIGKSIGTVLAAALAENSPSRDRIRFVFYTPLEETFSHSPGRAIAFTGTNDPWTGGAETRIPDLCREHGIPCRVIPDANHSLETDRPIRDIETLRDVMLATERFIREDEKN